MAVSLTLQLHSQKLKSYNTERIKSNFQQITLSKEDYEKITSIGKNKHTRFNIPTTYKPKWSINIFDEPEEKNATNQVKIA